MRALHLRRLNFAVQKVAELCLFARENECASAEIDGVIHCNKTSVWAHALAAALLGVLIFWPYMTT